MPYVDPCKVKFRSVESLKNEHGRRRVVYPFAMEGCGTVVATDGVQAWVSAEDSAIARVAPTPMLVPSTGILYQRSDMAFFVDTEHDCFISETLLRREWIVGRATGKLPEQFGDYMNNCLSLQGTLDLPFLWMESHTIGELAEAISNSNMTDEQEEHIVYSLLLNRAHPRQTNNERINEICRRIQNRQPLF